MNGYISIREIADDVLEHPLLQELNYERIINHTVNFIRRMGIPDSFFEKVIELDVHDYIAELPCDYYSTIQVKTRDGVMLRYTTDSFHLEPISIQKGCRDDRWYSPDPTYKIQGRTLISSMKNVPLIMAYKAFPADDDGYPMIPDNSSYKEALIAYIKLKQFTILFDQQKIPQPVLQNAKQDYAFAAGQAATSMIMPTMDQMESLTNMINTLIPRVREHGNGFATLGTKEYIRRK